MTESPEHLHVQFQDAFNRHDVEAIAALYEPDALLTLTSGPVRGVDAIREAYRAYVTTQAVIELQTLAVDRVGDLALLHGAWTLQETGPDGGVVRREGRNTEAVRLQPDGRWLFVIDNPSTPWD